MTEFIHSQTPVMCGSFAIMNIWRLNPQQTASKATAMGLWMGWGMSCSQGAKEGGTL